MPTKNPQHRTSLFVVGEFAALLLALVLVQAIFAANPPKEKPKPNRLAQESSAYLLQHANNPVDWYPWSAEAFAKAKKDGKLIFLSIGYSSCHWCHVMERETFENAAIAKVLNDNFVCIKVDREERPDIDDVYMTSLQVTRVGGGWPMSLFLTAEGKPIFGGTYFPPDDKKVGDETIPGFNSILKTVLDLHKNKKKELQDQADQVAELTNDALDRNLRIVSVVPLDAAMVKEATESYEFDPEVGGIGIKARGYKGTKFPRVAALQYIQQQAAKKGNEALAKSLTLTLDQMACGGIYDHLGGGFHRYSTERTWTVPHFEKMLYDNAQLVELYAEAYRQKPNEHYRRVIAETLAFVAREMTAPEGWFYAALDADSEGKEGEFYVWTAKELDAILGSDDDAKLFRQVYALEKPNFEEKQFILRLAKPLADAEQLKKFEPLKQKLFDVRAKRPRPFLDTKLITAWNGQMIGAYAKAGEVLKEPKYTQAAVKATEFLLKNLRNSDGRWLRIYAAKPGEKPSARVPAFLDDHAFLIQGLLNVHAATGEPKWLAEATKLSELQNKWFGDDKRGGYFSTAHDSEKLFARGKDSYDGAQPSGNGVAARNLLRLAQLTGEKSGRRQAEIMVQRLASTLKTNPTSVPLTTEALDTILASGGFAAESKVEAPKPPANPKTSADVITMTFKADAMKDGVQTFTVTLAMAKPWHIYANPPLGKNLAESATTIEILMDGKPLDTTIEYPPGTTLKDAGGEYQIYSGTIEIRGRVKRTDDGKTPLAARVKIVACNDRNCLLPSTLKAEAK